jgi:hypothetical protein
MTEEVKDTEQPLIQSEEDPVKKTLSTPLLKLYTIGLFALWADAVVNLCLILYPIITEVFNTSKSKGKSDQDAAKIVEFYMLISQFFTFLVGIKARLTLNDVEQSKFVVFLRVLGQLYLVMLGFFIIVYIALVATSNQINFEKISIVLIALHWAVFMLLYFKAVQLETVLIEKRKDMLRAMSTSRSASAPRSEA